VVWAGIEMKKGTKMTFEALMKVKRISDPQVHPGGKLAAFVETVHDPGENKVRSTIKLLDLDSGRERDLTPGEHSDSSPRWSPDGKKLLFVSDRKDGSQLWVLPFEEGGEAYQLTTGEGGASQPVWAPDGTRIAFARSVIVSPHFDGNAEDLPKEDRELVLRSRTYGLVNERSTARVEDSLLFRHWDHWRDRKRSHLFIMDIGTGKMNDLTPGDADVPPVSLGGSQDFVFSPGGDEIAYVMNPDPVVAVSTNNSIFVRGIDGTEPVGEPRNISVTGAMDLEPRYSPDGSYLSYLGAERPGYEADRLRIRLYDRRTGKTSHLLERFDRSVSEYLWNGDGFYFTAPDRGYLSLYRVSTESGDVIQYTSGVYQKELRMMPDGSLLMTREDARRPADIHIMRPGKGVPPLLEITKEPPPRMDQEVERVTDHGSVFEREGIELNPLESFVFRGADDDPVHGFLLKPQGFDQSRKYPLLFIIHGGPQSAFFDHFHYRWNPQLFAGEEYVVVEINPRGSTGYGQKFTDQISGDWGGRCYEDLMKGLDFVLDTFEFIDGDHIAAAGASFGGFMVNWIQGHTDRFRVLVSHDGIFNQETMSYMTEELWFDIWEHRGMPHEDHESFLRFSPHMFVQNFRTPMLVVQGELDFRCPVSEGISLFTALQVMNVPSRLLYFPDEGHWVEKPANSEVWYRTVRDFIAEHIRS